MRVSAESTDKARPTTSSIATRQAIKQVPAPILVLLAMVSLVIALQSDRRPIRWSATISGDTWLGVEIEGGAATVVIFTGLSSRSLALREMWLYAGRGLLGWERSYGLVSGRAGWRISLSRATGTRSRAHWKRQPSGYCTYVFFPALGLTLALLFPPGVAITFAKIRVHSRRKNGQCECCGYDLTGNVSGICSECGWPLDVRARYGVRGPVGGFTVFAVGYYLWMQVAGTDTMDGIVLSWPESRGWHAFVWYVVGTIPPLALSLFFVRRAQLEWQRCFMRVMLSFLALGLTVMALDQSLVLVWWDSYDPTRMYSIPYFMLVLVPGYLVAWITYYRPRHTATNE